MSSLPKATQLVGVRGSVWVQVCLTAELTLLPPAQWSRDPVTGHSGAGREARDSHVSPLTCPHVASWNNVRGGLQTASGRDPSGSRGQWVARAEHAVLVKPSLVPAPTCLGVALEFPHEQGHWPSAPGPGSPPASVHPGPQASLFSSLARLVQASCSCFSQERPGNFWHVA